jgi:hypothetical protein
MTSTLTMSPIDRHPISRRRDADSRFLVAAFFLAVLIVVAVAVAIAASKIPDVGSIYITVT